MLHALENLTNCFEVLSDKFLIEEGENELIILFSDSISKDESK